MLKWLFTEISENFRKESSENDVILWGKFPFFTKFLGDGILFLWDTKGLGQASLGNIIINLQKTCMAYTKDFYPLATRQFPKVPAKLRCGIARGQIIAIGGGKDFVGTCINEASRLQKVSQLSFVFSKKGLNVDECFSQTWRDEFASKRIAVRGFDEDVLVCILRREYDQLTQEEQSFFQE